MSAGVLVKTLYTITIKSYKDGKKKWKNLKKAKQFL